MEKWNRHPKGEGAGSLRNAAMNANFRLDILERYLDKGHMQQVALQLEALYPNMLKIGLAHPKRGKRTLIEKLQVCGEGPVQVEPGKDNVLVIDGVFNIEELGKQFMW